MFRDIPVNAQNVVANIVTNDGANISLTVPYLFTGIGWISLKLFNGTPSSNEKTETIRITYWLP
jgi:hypothetical protein